MSIITSLNFFIPDTHAFLRTFLSFKLPIGSSESLENESLSSDPTWKSKFILNCPLSQRLSCGESRPQGGGVRSRKFPRKSDVHPFIHSVLKVGFSPLKFTVWFILPGLLKDSSFKFPLTFPRLSLNNLTLFPHKIFFIKLIIFFYDSKLP